MSRRLAHDGARSDPPIRWFARLIVFLRVPIALGWIAAVVAAVLYLPVLGVERHHGLQALVPPDSAALEAELRSVRAFGYPLLARTVVVQRDPAGRTHRRER